MLLETLSQLNYRNLQAPKIEFSEGINAIVGNNASGKSNILEAVYLTCTGSLPSAKIAQAINWEKTQAFVSSQLRHQDGISKIEIGLNAGRKTIRVDGQSIQAVELARSVAAVLIAPADSELVYGSPAIRRRYIDSLLSKLSLRYAILLREYYRVLEQRNAILKNYPNNPTLEVWSEKFINLGNEIMSLRQRVLKRIADVVKTSYQEISRGDKTLEPTLQSGNKQPDLEAALLEKTNEERVRKVTVVGPHRDDLLLKLAGYSIQSFGSRGEARTTALSLRIAEYQLLTEKHNEPPILLIDDFSAELDLSRRNYLLNLAASTPQTLVSGTEAPPKFDKLFHILDGKLS